MCGITAFAVTAGVMSYYPAGTFSGVFSGLTAYAADDPLAGNSGNGSSTSPFQISNADELEAVLGRNDCYAELTADIVLNADLLNHIDHDTGAAINGYPIDRDWTGSRKTSNLNLNGKGHKISGFYFNDDTIAKAGLIGDMSGGSVKDLTISDSFVRGKTYVGVLAGSCTANLSKITVSDVVVVGTYTDTDTGTGAVCGYLNNSTADEITVSGAEVSGVNYVGGAFGRCWITG